MIWHDYSLIFAGIVSVHIYNGLKAVVFKLYNKTTVKNCNFCKNYNGYGAVKHISTSNHFVNIPAKGLRE